MGNVHLKKKKPVTMAFSSSLGVHYLLFFTVQRKIK